MFRERVPDFGAEPFDGRSFSEDQGPTGVGVKPAEAWQVGAAASMPEGAPEMEIQKATGVVHVEVYTLTSADNI